MMKVNDMKYINNNISQNYLLFNKKVSRVLDVDPLLKTQI